MYCPISEIFTSIQGEGAFTGTPVVFVRFLGCNLRCCFGNSICDTAYTSHSVENPLVADHVRAAYLIRKELTAHPFVHNIVFTGGEPMLHQKAILALCNELVDPEDPDELSFSIETNGSIGIQEFETEDGIKDSIASYIMWWSISPKLSNSARFEGSDVPQYMRNSHNNSRFNPEALGQMLNYNGQIKFVYDGPEIEQEIVNYVEDLKDIAQRHSLDGYSYWQPEKNTFAGWDIQIMPAGQTEEQINQNAQSAVKFCIDHGWTYCDRTHIRIWGDKRGV